MPRLADFAPKLFRIIQQEIHPAATNAESLVRGTPVEEFYHTLDYSTLPSGAWWDRPDVRNIAQQLYTQQGVESPFFRAWYGKTPYYMEDGRPQFWYHSSPVADISAFDMSRLTVPDAGLYAASNPEASIAYLRDAAHYRRPSEGEIYPLYIKAERPLEMTGAETWRDMKDAYIPKEFVDKDPYLQLLQSRAKPKFEKDYNNYIDRLIEYGMDYPEAAREADFVYQSRRWEKGLPLEQAMSNSDVNQFFIEALNDYHYGIAPTQAASLWTHSLPQYDALVTRNIRDGNTRKGVITDTITTRNPKNIKSPSNEGTFAPINNIYRSALAAPALGAAASALSPEQAYAATGGTPDLPVESSLAYDPVMAPLLAAAGVPSATGKLASILADLGLTTLMSQPIPDVAEEYYTAPQ